MAEWSGMSSLDIQALSVQDLVKRMDLDKSIQDLVKTRDLFQDEITRMEKSIQDLVKTRDFEKRMQVLVKRRDLIQDEITQMEESIQDLVKRRDLIQHEITQMEKSIQGFVKTRAFEKSLLDQVKRRNLIQDEITQMEKSIQGLVKTRDFEKSIQDLVKRRDLIQHEIIQMDKSLQGFVKTRDFEKSLLDQVKRLNLIEDEITQMEKSMQDLVKRRDFFQDGSTLYLEKSINDLAERTDLSQVEITQILEKSMQVLVKRRDSIQDGITQMEKSMQDLVKRRDFFQDESTQILEKSGAKMKTSMKSVELIKEEESIGISSPDNEVESILVLVRRDVILDEIIQMKKSLQDLVKRRDFFQDEVTQILEKSIQDLVKKRDLIQDGITQVEKSGAKMKTLMKSVQLINKEESIVFSHTDNEFERIVNITTRQWIREVITGISFSNSEVERDGKMSPSNTSQLPTRSHMKALRDATLPMVPLFDGENDAIGRMKALSYGGTPKSQEQKLLEKPNLYLSIHGDLQVKTAFLKHFNLVTIEECNVGVVIISKFSLGFAPEIVDLVPICIRDMDLVWMVKEAKRRSDFKILPVMLDVSLAELDDPEMQEHMRKQWDWMELNMPWSIKAADYAAAFEYIRACDCMVNTGLTNIEFWHLVFHRIYGIILVERNTEKLRGTTPPISTKDYNTARSSKIRKVTENSSPKLMMLQPTSVNDPDWSKDLGGERKSKSAVDSDSDKGYAEAVKAVRFLETLPPLPRMPYSFMNAHKKDMKALSDGGTSTSPEGLQMTDAVQLQLDGQQDLQDQVEALLEEEGPNWRRDSSSSTHKDAGEIIKDGYDILRDEISDTIMRDDNLEGANDLHGNIEHGYEAFKDQICEDIKRIDCIEEMSIDGVDTMTLLRSQDIVILSFFDENESIFKFYFKNREDMASIVGGGLEHAVVILESGEVTIKEITDHDWNERWRSIETNSCEKRKLFKMKMPTPSNAYEGVHLDVELSYEKPSLWELTKYFSLRESIETFVTKDFFVEYAQGVETSSSTSFKNQGEELVPKFTMLLAKSATNGGLQENGNEGSTSYKTEKRVTKGSEDTATIVKLQLLREGYELIDDFPGTIMSNLELQFTNEGGVGEDGKEVRITVGTVSFELGRDKEHNQSPWYHEDLKVVFGLLNGDAKDYGEINRGSFKSLEMRDGKVNMKTSSTHGHTTGKESSGKGRLSIKPPWVESFGEYEQKRSSQDTGTELSERSAEISNNDYTQGGLILNSSVNDSRIVCDYSPPKGDASLGPPSTCHFYDQYVMFQGTWLPIGERRFVEYTLIATRCLCSKIKNSSQKQVYTKTMLVNHSMTHLDGKTYILRERKPDSKSILTEIGSWSEPGWSEPLVEMKDIPNEARDANIQNVDQETINRSLPNSSRRIYIPQLFRGALSTRSANSHGETLTPDSRQESQQVNGNTSNPTRRGFLRRTRRRQV